MNVYEQLKRPFHPSKISWRAGATNAKKNNGVATKCIALAYIDARDVMERLDEVFGLDGWQCRYSHAENKTICEISVLVDGAWITRANGAGDSDIEAEKGAISDAFKRAAVLFGIGRYLYDIPNTWVDCDEWKHIKSPPQLPAWATPEGYEKGLAKEIPEPKFPAARMAMIEQAVTSAIDAYNAGDIATAHDLLYGDELLHDNDERLEAWGRLKDMPPLRSAIKKYRTENYPVTMKEAA